MPRKRNPTVFTGTYKDACRKISKKTGTTKRAPMHRVRGVLHGGPFDGKTVLLFDWSNTLPIEIGGQRGMYVGGHWKRIP